MCFARNLEGRLRSFTSSLRLAAKVGKAKRRSRHAIQWPTFRGLRASQILSMSSLLVEVRKPFLQRRVRQILGVGARFPLLQPNCRTTEREKRPVLRLGGARFRLLLRSKFPATEKETHPIFRRGPRRVLPPAARACIPCLPIRFRATERKRLLDLRPKFRTTETESHPFSRSRLVVVLRVDARFSRPPVRSSFLSRWTRKTGRSCRSRVKPAWPTATRSLRAISKKGTKRGRLHLWLF
mmetsp:Transcript_20783/g.52334  ORF Transcript_20783/g.52334 Transcript_20783/m.52334 type:complete len:239 (-) Transcript_20783:1490-2206(-)